MDHIQNTNHIQKSLHERFVKACIDEDFVSIQTMLNYVSASDICGGNHRALRAVCRTGNIPIFKMIADKLYFTSINIRANNIFLINAFISGNFQFIEWLVQTYELNAIDLRECVELSQDYVAFITQSN